MGAIKIKGETSGSTTIVAPATGSDVTMTLPGSSLDLGAELASKLPIAGGKILQVVRATDSTQRTTTSTSYVDVTGMSVTITPQKSDSSILILATVRQGAFWTSGESGRARYRITDASDNPLSGAEDQIVGTANLTGSSTRVFTSSMFLLGVSTPSTINPVTYKLRFQASDSGVTAQVNSESQTGQMFAIEVSA